jgi:autocrine motility factor receptor
MALDALHAALSDATSEELRAYDDECAICRVCLLISASFLVFHWIV